MENIIAGIPTMLVCAVIYFLSFRFLQQNKLVLAVTLLMAGGLLLRVYTATEFYLHPWDERYHALVAKNLIHHPMVPTLYDNPVLPYDYRHWFENHIWLHKQPFPLWTMAASLYLFGVNEIALRLPSIILSTTGIWITYKIGYHIFCRRVGFIAAFLFSIHGLIIELTAGRVATDHIDVFFLFFIQFAVLMSIRFAETKKLIFNVLCGFAVGIAILTKWLPALIVIPVWLLLVTGSRRFTLKETILQVILLCLIISAVFLPWQIYIHTSFPLEAGWENQYNMRHITEVLDGHGQPFYYHFDNIRILFGELIYIPMIWIAWKSIKNRKNHKRMLLIIWLFIPLIFFSFVKTKMQGYILFSAPALFIITALFWHYLYRYRAKIRYRWPTYAMLFLLLALPVRYSIERIKPFESRDRSPRWAKEIKSLKSGTGGFVLFNYDRPIEAMFYMDCIAYQVIPDKRTVENLLASGYEVIINDDGKLPEYLNSSDKVRRVRLTRSGP